MSGARHQMNQASGRLRRSARRLVIASSLAACFPTMTRAEDLMDAFHQAILNDPVLATADATRLVVAEGVPQARSALLPKLSVGLGMTQIRSGGSATSTDSNGNIVDTTSGGRTRARSLSGTLSTPIINVSDIAALSAAKLTRSSEEETYRAALQDLYVRVAQAYLNVLIATDNLEVYESYEDAYKSEFEQTSSRYKAGLTMQSDVSQSEAYYLYIKSKRISAMDGLKDARRALEQITGAPTGTLKHLRDEIPMDLPQPSNAEAWVEVAKDNNPKIRASDLRVSSDEHVIRQHRAEHLPTLDATVERSKYGSWSNSVPGTSAFMPGSTQVGLTLTVPIFTGGLTQSLVRQAIDQRDSDAGVLESDRRDAIRNVHAAYNAIVDGIEQVNDARNAVASAKKALTSMKAGYEAGTQNLTNVVVAIQILAEIRTEYSTVRHAFVLNKLLLKQASGTIDVNDLEDVNRLLD